MQKSVHCGLQGVAESRTLQDANGHRYTLALLARRSCLHPGMRYIARGLNSLASPGNEIECEQVLWTQPASLEQPLKWSSYAWRRGTVPIWWGVQLKSGGVGEAEIVIPSATPYRGTRRYGCAERLVHVLFKLQAQGKHNGFRHFCENNASPSAACVKPNGVSSEHMSLDIRNTCTGNGSESRAHTFELYECHMSGIQQELLCCTLKGVFGT